MKVELKVTYEREEIAAILVKQYERDFGPPPKGYNYHARSSSYGTEFYIELEEVEEIPVEPIEKEEVTGIVAPGAGE